MRHLAMIVALFSLLMSFPIAALALDEYQSYFGIDYNLTDLEPDRGDALDLDAISGRFGSYLNRNTALEARLGFSAADDKRAGVEYELDYFVGVYARGILPYETVELYGLLGFTRAEVGVSPAGGALDGDDTGFSYGGGLAFKVGPRVAFSVEYLMLIDSSDYELSATSVGCRYHF
ncbi:MAG: hypothetical protein C0618_00995 [Desulfuromonas sp.]|nr:MAG: hypothetical protein C0618_00995 [Desulfuromonas sp.]